MAEKTVVGKAAEAVGFGIAIASDVAGSIKTAIDATVSTVTEALKKTPSKDSAIEKASAKKAAKKTSAKQTVKTTGAKKTARKAPVKKSAVENALSKRVTAKKVSVQRTLKKS